MNIRHPAVQLLAVSLLAALAIILASMVFEEQAQTLTFVIIAIWWIPFSILSVRRARK